MDTDVDKYHEQLFELRYRIARVGEQDWLKWWDSEALTGPGLYAMERLFRRTPRLSAAHLSMLAARARHDRDTPSEPLIHLFNFGESVEGAFERWLIDRKSEGWVPSELPEAPEDESRTTVQSSFAAVDLADYVVQDGDQVSEGLLNVGTVTSGELTDPGRRLEWGKRLVAGYRSGAPGSLVVPHARLRES